MQEAVAETLIESGKYYLDQIDRLACMYENMSTSTSTHDTEMRANILASLNAARQKVIDINGRLIALKNTKNLESRIFADINYFLYYCCTR